MALSLNTGNLLTADSTRTSSGVVACLSASPQCALFCLSPRLLEYPVLEGPRACQPLRDQGLSSGYPCYVHAVGLARKQPAVGAITRRSSPKMEWHGAIARVLEVDFWSAMRIQSSANSSPMIPQQVGPLYGVYGAGSSR